MSGLAPKLPLTISELDGAYELIDDYIDLIEQNFKMLLLTGPGEKMMNPDYGVGIKRYLFENQITQTATQSAVKARIISQAGKYMPYIDISVVNFAQIENLPNGIYVYVEYDITPLNVTRTFDTVINIDSLF